MFHKKALEAFSNHNCKCYLFYFILKDLKQSKFDQNLIDRPQKNLSSLI